MHALKHTRNQIDNKIMCIEDIMSSYNITQITYTPKVTLGHLFKAPEYLIVSNGYRFYGANLIECIDQIK